MQLRAGTTLILPFSLREKEPFSICCFFRNAERHTDALTKNIRANVKLYLNVQTHPVELGIYLQPFHRKAGPTKRAKRSMDLRTLSCFIPPK